MRTYEYINSGWRFSKVGGLPEGRQTEPKSDDNGWELVELPHTWNAADCTGVSGRASEYSEGYYRGAGCYRRKVKLPHEQYHGKHVFIEFAGANTTTVLFVNGKKAGVHVGGYSAFRFDITKLVRPGADNQFTVYVSNATSEFVAPIGDCGDFTKMGGIYRAVRLIAVDKLRIALRDNGSSGVYITAKPEADCGAEVRVLVKLENDSAEEKNAVVRVTISGGAANIQREAKLTIAPGEASAEFSLKLPGAHLWDGVRDPFLYSAKIAVLSGGTALDGVTEQFGVREFSIDREKGFFLNGKHTPLHGVNYHQDSPRAGWAMTNKQRERDYAVMRDMGCNAVRMAHYQHASEEYALCDKLGMCVWTEIGIIGKLCPGEPAEPQLSREFADNAMQQLTELIAQTYNHPSVMFYGMSNEIYQMSDSIHSLYEQMYDYISENGGGGAISQHKDNVNWLTDIDPNGERHYENYQSRLHEQIWTQIGSLDYLWAKLVWCMFDFPAAGRREGDTAGINDKGLCTRERVPKDAYWFYRSVWNSEKTCRLTEKRFTERPANVPEVRAYSNAERAELLLNGNSLGFGKVPDKRLPTVFVWKDVKLRPGKNDLLLRAFYSDGTVLEDGASWETSC